MLESPKTGKKRGFASSSPRKAFKKRKAAPADEKATKAAFGDAMDYEETVITAGTIFETSRSTCHHVVLSQVMRGRSMKLSDDQLSLTGTQGYRTARATHGCFSGEWFFEVDLFLSSLPNPPDEEPPYKPNWRVGWMSQHADVEGPVGFENESIGYRDIDGSAIQKGIRRPYGKPFGVGDTIGALISLPNEGSKSAPEERELVFIPRMAKTDQASIFIEKKDMKELDNFQILPGAWIEFFVNGVSQGKVETQKSWVDLKASRRYYPAISIFEYGQAVARFEHPFKYPPVENGWKPINDLYPIRKEEEDKEKAQTQVKMAKLRAEAEERRIKFEQKEKEKKEEGRKKKEEKRQSVQTAKLLNDGGQIENEALSIKVD